MWVDVWSGALVVLMGLTVVTHTNTHTCVVQEEKVENSHSYPGMMSKYVLHSVDALVEGLPTHKFTTLERDSCGDVRLESTWDWFSAAPENNAQTAGDAPSSLK
jgi:hypothetical protein